MPVKAKSAGKQGQQKFSIRLRTQPGIETAYFTVPFDVEEVFATRARVPVRGTINGVPYRSSIMNMGEGHCMIVNRNLREAAKVKAGDTVEIVMERDSEERTVELPPDFKKALAAAPTASAFFKKLSYTHRKEYAHWITGAKREETRKSRLDKAIPMLQNGVNTPL
jgi:ribosomal 50S subunit-recycling heat shock protein